MRVFKALQLRLQILQAAQAEGEELPEVVGVLEEEVDEGVLLLHDVAEEGLHKLLAEDVDRVRKVQHELAVPSLNALVVVLKG